MDYETKQREAVYLIKKYSSVTWYAEAFRLFKQFCEDYERDFYRKPVAGYQVTDWDEQNLRMFWSYASEMEDGLAAVRKGDLWGGRELMRHGGTFGQWLYSRRFDEVDMEPHGYRRGKYRGASQGIFANAERANDMVVAASVFTHTDRLRRDRVELPNNWEVEYGDPAALALKIPYGVPPGELAPLPDPDPQAPVIRSGDPVPEHGIWVVEPDAAHRGQTYCMAYLVTWAPALETISEQEYERNTLWSRTRDQTAKNDCDAIKDYPVRWRLLWRDTRYSGGSVPAEEADYLTYRPPTGQPPAREGWWYAAVHSGTRRYFRQGETLPHIDNPMWASTLWQFVGDQAGGTPAPRV
ncbi:MAG: hypothetical protein HUU30_20265 [Burkholderiaceae bacterium]|nr:hypothetical protein [Burkholderiaceae bacterium]